MSGPKIIDWRITSTCNCLCSYCYASEVIDSVSKKNENIILKKICDSECEIVCISGGEPLLDYTRVINIIKMLKKYNKKIFLLCNNIEKGF